MNSRRAPHAVHVRSETLSALLALPIACAVTVGSSLSTAQETPPRPQEPRGPLPYEAVEISFETWEGITLAGTLTLPKGKGPFPAVVLVPGASPFDRDESIFGHRPFLVLSDYLTRRGIAALRLDDRGVGGSSGVKMVVGLEVLADDVLAAVEYLRDRREIDDERIGLIGHSQGAILAPIAAARSGEIGFIVLLCGMGRMVPEVMALQEARDGTGTARTNRAMMKAMVSILHEVPDAGEAKKAIKRRWEEMVSSLPKSEQEGAKTFASNIEAQFRVWVDAPMFRSTFTTDPQSTLERVACPLLAVSGGFDSGTANPSDNLPAMALALEAGGNVDYAIVKLPRLNHLLQTSETGVLSECATIEETIAPAALEIVGNWVSRVTGASTDLRPGPQHVSFPTRDGGVVHADAYGQGDRAVVLAHGGRFTKESWAEQAPTLAEAGFRVVAIDFRGRGQSRGGPGSGSPDEGVHLDVLAAVRYLRRTGAKAVSVVGASFGGWAAAQAVVEAPGEIDRIVLLAATVEQPERLAGRKLFILTRDDFSGGGVPRLPEIREQYERAPEPKELVILEGSAHAQFVFETDQGQRLMHEILRFLSEP